MISKLAVALALVLSVSVHLGQTQNLAQCSNIWSPVCGTDGKNYSNRCYFEQAVKSNADLKILHYGICEDGFPVCSDNYQPICGSNGVTYANRCYFQYASLADPTLTIVKYKECSTVDQSARTKIPLVCGSDGELYTYEGFDKAKLENPSLEIVDFAFCIKIFDL